MNRIAGLVAVTVVLLGAAEAARAEVRVGPNYRLDSDLSPFRGRDLIGLAVSPGDPQRVVQINANYLDLRCEASLSTDGGSTWGQAVALVPPDAGAGQAPFAPGCGFHNSVQFGSGMNVYAVVTASRTTAASGTTGSIADAAVIVYRSTDGGSTWQKGVVALAEGAGTDDSAVASMGPSYTRPAVAVQAAGGPGGADRVYAVARDIVGKDNQAGGCTPVASPPASVVSCPNPMRVAYSENGGQSFVTRTNASPLGLRTTDPGVAVVNTDGSLTVVWRTTTAPATPADPVGKLQAARSTDQGQNWGAPVDIADVRNTGTAVTTHVPPTTAPLTAGVSASATSPKIAIDPNIPGRIYLVYGQSPHATLPYTAADHFVSPDQRVYFQRSSDFGATWTAPKRVSDATSLPGARTHQTRHANVSVSPNGRVNVVWHDRRHWTQGRLEHNCTHSHIFCDEIRLGDTYYAYSTNGGDTFSPNIRINDRSQNNEVGYDTRPAGYWWSGPQSVTVGGDRLLVAWMDSREGNWDTDTEDVYLAKVDFNASGTAPQTTLNDADVVARSVALSKIAYQGGNEGALVGGAIDPDNDGVGSPATGPASRNASSVVVVNPDDLAGAMAATVLARANPGPVLVSPAAGLPASVKTEIARMRPAKAFVIGDSASLSAQVVTDIAAAAGILPGKVTRLSGASSAATAAAIASQMDYRRTAERAANQPAFDAAVIANPANPQIAASAVALAAARRLPILYVSADAIPAETATALSDLKIDTTLVVGGTSVVGAAVFSGLPGATRLDGADQYAVSRSVVAQSLTRGLPSNVVYVADGTRPLDATLLSGVVARATGILVLAPAPLASTAVAQAASFGLSGIAKYVLLNALPDPVAPPPPPPPPVAPPPVAPPAAPPPPPGAGDTEAPKATLSGATRQKVGPTVSVGVTCTSEPCTATVGAVVKVPKFGKVKAKTFKLTSIKAKLAKGKKRTFKLALSPSRRLAILRALKARKVPSARFTVTVADAAANKRTLGRTVRFRR